MRFVPDREVRSDLERQLGINAIFAGWLLSYYVWLPAAQATISRLSSVAFE